MRFSTPLRYPGGKGKLTEFIQLVFVQNDLIGGEYVEPYAGGAGIALNLLMHHYVTRIHLNDLNRAVYAFWHSVVNEPDELCKKIVDAKLTIEEWELQKTIQRNSTEQNLLDLGFSTFYLNRTNRSGIIKGGIIGGKAQSGVWKMDARFNKERLCKRIEQIALWGDQISLYNIDAAEMISTVLPELPEKTLVYLDPPYYVKGHGLYENHYKHDDHKEIADKVLAEITHPWIVSYDHVPEIVGLYPGCQSLVYGINYSAQDKYKGAEVMFFSDQVKIPDCANPSDLKAA